MLPGAWTVGLTVFFTASGLYCLWRVAAGRGRGIEALVDVNHVLMSPAMVLMLWWPTFGAGKWVQIAVFTGLALVFFHHLAGVETVTARTGALLHGGMNLGMAWMVAAMPLLMPAMPDMSGMTGHEHAGAGAGPLSWTAMLSWVVAGLLSIAAVWWFIRVIRVAGHRILCGCHGLTCAGMAAMLVLVTPAL
jgi:hypothetical protein